MNIFYLCMLVVSIWPLKLSDKYDEEVEELMKLLLRGFQPTGIIGGWGNLKISHKHSFMSICS